MVVTNAFKVIDKVGDEVAVGKDILVESVVSFHGQVFKLKRSQVKVLVFV